MNRVVQFTGLGHPGVHGGSPDQPRRHRQPVLSPGREVGWPVNSTLQQHHSPGPLPEDQCDAQSNEVVPGGGGGMPPLPLEFTSHVS